MPVSLTLSVLQPFEVRTGPERVQVKTGFPVATPRAGEKFKKLGGALVNFLFWSHSQPRRGVSRSLNILLHTGIHSLDSSFRILL